MSQTPTMPQLKKPAHVLETRPAGVDEKFGTRAIERVQQSHGFEDQATQDRMEYLHALGYTLATVTSERLLKDYIEMDQARESASSHLAGQDGMLFTTMYFERPHVTKPASKGKFVKEIKK
jgi:hypothetical protein